MKMKGEVMICVLLPGRTPSSGLLAWISVNLQIGFLRPKSAIWMGGDWGNRD